MAIPEAPAPPPPTAAEKAERVAALEESIKVQQQHPMSNITGARKPLAHVNSLPTSSDKIPKYGVETPYEEELGQVNIEGFQDKT